MPGRGTAGGTNAAGVPEISGSFAPQIQNNSETGLNVLPVGGFSGAFRSQGSALTAWFSPQGTGKTMERGVTLAASLCSKVYGGANTVMPPSIDIPYILYLGVPA